MHVFCPDCNAEYKVNERSSLTKTVKFVCIECGSSWVDKFKKLEQEKSMKSISEVSTSKDVIENTKKKLETIELNSLALEEVQYSYGNDKNSIPLETSNTKGEHIFQFETTEVAKEIGKEGPSETFPKIRNNKENTADEQIEERDAKEIEIEKRLKESSELLKKAKQPNIENTQTVQKEDRPKNRKILIPFSILMVVSFFIYNLTTLFLEDIIREAPFVEDILIDIIRYTEILKDNFLMIIERIMNFISNLA